ncbi:MAG: decarboxylating 6-phosphogluconate dehydrogenase [Acidimicrobiales bacterium]|nr:decarboxylating 6-phosphogluconate dehydrogenase [Acidimicrobiales bacterium]RZV48492.1 MAG: decarboxylating 6-phosphogluconate dehydrogenase [Acidimicrobiales bacterium]
MQVGMVGIGRMGQGLIKRLLRDGHTAVAYDINPEPVDEIAKEGAVPTHTLEEFAAALETPRVAWVMVPAAYAGSTVDKVAEHFEEGDIIIDGGNSMWQDDVDKAAELSERGIHYVDIGTSGGVFGLERGFSLMIGGEDDVIEHLSPVFDTLAPGVAAAERSLDDGGPLRPGEPGWLHCGPNGAGHFVKMVHNGVEYGMMAAVAEGLAIIKAAGAGLESREVDAETTPLRNPQYYQYDIDPAAVAEVWRRGSVVSSWLIDLTAQAMAIDPALDEFEGRVSDSGEGRWTVQAAIELGIPAHTIASSLFERFASRDRDEFANKVLSAMRKGFGGHHEKKG